MRLPSDISAEDRDKLLRWGQRSFHRFKVSDAFAEVRCGGFFLPHRAPATLAQFQRGVATNCKNWGLDRQETRYQRGWLQFASPAQWELHITTPHERYVEVEGLVKEVVDGAWRQLCQRKAARAARLTAAASKLASVTQRRTKLGFDALAPEVRARRAKEAAAREAKTLAFNQERFGLATTRVAYSSEELECDSWQAVKKRRIACPRDARKDREDERLAQIERDCQEQRAYLARLGQGLSGMPQ